MNCASCSYFAPSPDGEVGICRRFPPQVIPAFGLPLGVAFFPTVAPSIWCGEFLEREAPPSSEEAEGEV